MSTDRYWLHWWRRRVLREADGFLMLLEEQPVAGRYHAVLFLHEIIFIIQQEQGQRVLF